MNDSKTEFIIIGSYQQLAKINLTSIMVGEHRITAVDDIQNLGAYLDKNLSMKTHVDVKCNAAFCQLYSFRRIRKYLSHQATESLIHAFIFSHIDYCNGLLNSVSKHLINKLQRIQNMVARLVHKLPKFSHVTPLLIDLHWLPVEYCVRYKILLFTYKAIHMNGCFSFCLITYRWANFLKNRTNFLLNDKLLLDLCHGFFWSEENVDLNYFPTHNGVWVLVCLEFFLGRC